MKRTLIAMAAAIAVSVQTPGRTAEKPTAGTDNSMLRIKATGLNTDDWLSGKFVHAQGCTMIKLDRPSPGGYTSLLLVGISHLQVYKSGQWADMTIAPMLKSEPAHCRAGGSD